MIENKELKFAGFGVALLLIWFLYVKDAIAPFLASQPPYIAAIVYHLGIYAGVYLLSAILVKGYNRMKFSIISISILMGLDIVDAPYVISNTGAFNTSMEYWFTTYDAMFGSILNMFISGHALWAAVYIVVPILLIFIIPIMIAKPGAIKKALLNQ